MYDSNSTFATESYFDNQIQQGTEDASHRFFQQQYYNWSYYVAVLCFFSAGTLDLGF